MQCCSYKASMLTYAVQNLLLSFGFIPLSLSHENNPSQWVEHWNLSIIFRKSNFLKCRLCDFHFPPCFTPIRHAKYPTDFLVLYPDKAVWLLFILSVIQRNILIQSDLRLFITWNLTVLTDFVTKECKLNIINSIVVSTSFKRLHDAVVSASDS